MNNQLPKFNFRDISKWRSVDLRWTKEIAHRCTKRVDYQGCSKSQIIEGVAKPFGYESDAKKFVAMMDKAAKFIPDIRVRFDKEVSDRLKEVEKQFANDKEQTGEALSASPCSCPPESRDSTGLGDTCDRVEVFEDPTNNNENPCDEENPEQPPSEKESSVGPLRRRNNECARILHRSWMMSR